MDGPDVAAPQQLTGKPAAWRIAAVSATCAFVIGLLPTALPVLSAAFELSNTATASIVSAFALGRILVPFPSGWAAQRWGATRATDVGVACCVVAAVGAVFGRSFIALVMAMFVAGVGVGIVMTASIALILGVSAPGSLGRMATINQMAINVGHVIAPLAGGLAASVWGVRGPFLTYLLATTVAAVVWVVSRSRLRPTGSQHHIDDADGSPTPPRGAMTTVVVSALVFFWSLSGVSQTLVPLYAQRELGLGTVQIGWLMMVPAMVGILVIVPLGRLVDRRGGWPVFGIALGSVVLSAMVLGAWGATTAVVIALVLAGVAKAGAVAPEAALVDGMVARRSRGVGVGLFRSALGLGTFLGPVSLAAVADAFGFGAAFWLATAGVVAVWGWAQLMRRWTGASSQAPAVG